MQINFYPQSIGFGLPLDVYSNPSIQNQSYKNLLAEFSSEESFEEMWQKKFGGQTFYHVMGTSSFPHWSSRLDFPFEKFFADEVDESVSSWRPTGANPPMDDAKVQRRLDSTLGKNVVVVPPSLDEKMQNDPALRKKVMANIDAVFLANPPRTDIVEIHSSLIILDEEGEVSAYRLTGGGVSFTYSCSGDPEAEEKKIARHLQQLRAEQSAFERRMMNERSSGASDLVDSIM